MEQWIPKPVSNSSAGKRLMSPVIFIGKKNKNKGLF
jgi:hypothetical protein